MQERIEQVLMHHGYEHYETAAFARKGHQCRHNLNYWHFGDYLGIGAGAHSKLSYHDRITRERRHKHPNRYMEQAAKRLAVEEVWTIPADELGFEFMMNTLRLTGGFDVRLFQQRTGRPIQDIEQALKLAKIRGLVVVEGDTVKPTLLGQRFLNELLQLFLQ